MTPEMQPRFLRAGHVIARWPIALAAVSLAVAVTTAVWAVMQIAAPPEQQLTMMLPQGALLTIEAKDFSATLKRWNNSPEKQSWLKSNNYDVFSRSRLFSRLGDAQSDFARAAGLPPDMNFLNEVAGTQSVFAWYDIGRLEFLYITRMPADQAEKTRLVQLRGKFTARQVAGQTFYIRNSSSPSIVIPPVTDNTQSTDAANDAGGGEVRTVAFAMVGDRLLLATREDLMAGALMLMSSSKSGANASAAGDSLAREPWFTQARAAATKEPGDLRMTLNLDRIVPSPYFRSYWVQRNVTEMKQYRSAVADLYLAGSNFHEERVLLAKDEAEPSQPGADLRTLTAMLPDHAGVYRAVTAPSVDSATSSIDEKLLARNIGSYSDSRYAPQADVSVQSTGSASDLETRIDVPLMITPAKGSELDPLRHTFEDAGITGMMTVDRTGPARDGVWVPFASGVVLSAVRPWNQSAVQDALKQALGAHLTAGALGLDWKSVQAGNVSYLEISDARPLEVAFRGNLCIVADDPSLMRDMLGHASQPKRSAAGASDHETLIAGFDLTHERTPYARWTNIVDHVAQRTAAAQNSAAGDASDDTGDNTSSSGEPGFFSRNMRSLGTAFSALQSEQIIERREGMLVRQTVTYAWKQ